MKRSPNGDATIWIRGANYSGFTRITLQNNSSWRAKASLYAHNSLDESLMHNQICGSVKVRHRKRESRSSNKMALNIKLMYISANLRLTPNISCVRMLLPSIENPNASVVFIYYLFRSWIATQICKYKQQQFETKGSLLNTAENTGMPRNQKTL